MSASPYFPREILVEPDKRQRFMGGAFSRKGEVGRGVLCAVIQKTKNTVPTCAGVPSSQNGTLFLTPFMELTRTDFFEADYSWHSRENKEETRANLR
jgi:hypothetical protein